MEVVYTSWCGNTGPEDPSHILTISIIAQSSFQRSLVGEDNLVSDY